MSHLLLFLSFVLFGAILLIREGQYQRQCQALLNRLLVKNGIEPIPEKQEEERTEHHGLNPAQAASVQFRMPGGFVGVKK